MYYLHMRASEFGIKGHETVRAPYDSRANAEAQAEHNIERNVQMPLRIEHHGEVLVDYTNEVTLAEVRSRIADRKAKAVMNVQTAFEEG
jgi:hypothetical protein